MPPLDPPARPAAPAAGKLRTRSHRSAWAAAGSTARVAGPAWCDPMLQPDPAIRAPDSGVLVPGRSGGSPPQRSAPCIRKRCIIGAHGFHRLQRGGQRRWSGTVLVMEPGAHSGVAGDHDGAVHRFALEWQEGGTGAANCQRKDLQGRKTLRSGILSRDGWAAIRYHDDGTTAAALADALLKNSGPADVNIDSVRHAEGVESMALAWVFHSAGQQPPTIRSTSARIRPTRSEPFQDLVPSISLRGERAGARYRRRVDEWHQPTDVFDVVGRTSGSASTPPRRRSRRSRN